MPPVTLRRLFFLVLPLLLQRDGTAWSFDFVEDHTGAFATYSSAWSNRTALHAAFKNRTCTQHAQCDDYEFCFGLVGFGDAGAGVCQNFFTETCTKTHPCDIGDGDCDTDFDCVSDLVCGAFLLFWSRHVFFSFLLFFVRVSCVSGVCVGRVGTEVLHCTVPE